MHYKRDFRADGCITKRVFGGLQKTSDAGLRETTFLIKKICLVLFGVLSLGPFSGPGRRREAVADRIGINM